MKNLKTQLGLRKNIDQFNNLDRAKSWASHCVKPHIVIMGDNQKFWVVCFSDAQRLVKMGYEVAK